jgi:hypothetical protein
MDDWIKDLENAMDVVFPVVSEYNKNINYGRLESGWDI